MDRGTLFHTRSPIEGLSPSPPQSPFGILDKEPNQPPNGNRGIPQILPYPNLEKGAIDLLVKLPEQAKVLICNWVMALGKL